MGRQLTTYHGKNKFLRPANCNTATSFSDVAWERGYKRTCNVISAFTITQRAGLVIGSLKVKPNFHTFH